MKELTIEEKAKRYDKAFKKAMVINSGKYVEIPAEDTVLEYIFPELKESEDEKMLKAITQGIRDMADGHGWSDFGGFPIDDILAWLEKQGKQEILCDKCKKEQPSHSCQDMKTLMTLDEAIEHCNEKSCDDTACGKNHKQLAEWLTELKGYRNSFAQEAQKPANNVEPEFRNGQWAVDWISCEEGDSIKDFTGDTAEEAINEAYNWFHSTFCND